jgi:hypothetical protein
MADGLVIVSPDSTGKKIDTSELTVGVNTVERQRIVIADPTNATQLATVSASGAVANKSLTDTNRTYVILFAQAVTGVTTEALITFTKNVNGTTTTAQTAYTITSGKTFRIQSISYLVKNTTTTANSGTVNVRVAATVSATSPLVASLFVSAPAAVASAVGADSIQLVDGIDILGNGSIQIGISHIENIATASIVSFTLTGYEYTA